ncbi:MAG: molybdopterin converting factor subunit 1 [Opitutales bacterium]
MQVTLKYFAILREQRGLSEETLYTELPTAGELYKHLKEEHGFSLNPNQLRIAVNDTFVSSETELKDGDVLVFIPPVAGG